MVFHLFHTLGPRRKAAVGVLTTLALAAAATTTAGALRGCPGLGPLRIATFNIEEFPQSERQVTGAFEAIGELDAPVVAVQEITDPGAFAKAARRHLGDSWKFTANRRGAKMRLGVLYDDSEFELVRTKQHDGPSLDGRHRPAVEVVLRPRAGGRDLRVVVVHLKAGGADGLEIRRRQLEELEQVLANVLGGDDKVVVMGDFNAATPEDRALIAGMADRLELYWASEALGCTAYWEPPQRCLGVALDHVLVNGPALQTEALGPCETEGCDPGDQCPVFRHEVSDHCPVVSDIL